MEQYSNKKHWYLVPLTGLLLFAAWPTSPFTILIFVAWVPLLFLEQKITRTATFFWIAALNMLIWNGTTTWWIWNSTGPGAVGAIMANSLIMCFPLMLFRATRLRLGNTTGYFSLILYWLSFEYLHHNWELTWPWLTLGNVFATHPYWVQWYEYTGTTGGSLWVLLFNVLLIHNLISQPQNRRRSYGATAAVFIPFIISILIKPTEQAPSAMENVVVVQPNVEAYTEKFTTPPQVLVGELIRLSESSLDSNTRLLVWPETAIPSQAWEHELNQNRVFQPVFEFLKQHPKLMLVTGIDSYKLWGQNNPGIFSARPMDNGMYYEAFNTAMAADSSLNLQLYHKSKLVPGVESLPSWLGFMGSLFDDFGGISGTLGRSDSAVVFTQKGNPYHPAPIICYESIFSDYETEYVRRGANILTVITNDGWWGNTQGHKQHMNMSRLRAIENRKWVARSANTGISCFISPEGDVISPLPWNKSGTIKYPIPVKNETTFYACHGDYLSRAAWPAALLLLLVVVIKKITGRKKQLN